MSMQRSLSVATVSPAKTDEPIVMPVGGYRLV